ncbi:uncharacterized protein LOC135330962 [Halichondria panicea]|uniref:uncharacterized protein LOC135330962 n=1 Tax=Halichondria panicea TaxID=6063 RepID=UPI00312B762B
MDKFSWRTLIVFLFSLIELCTSQAPSLARALLPSYRVNPSTSPFFSYCSFNGDPTPQISWSFEGQMLPTDSSQGGPYYIPATGVLVLSGASSGMYTCTGMNQLGMDSQTITITIVGRITTAPWYLMPYMWFVYILIVWAICVVLMVLLFYYKKKRAEADLAPVDSWLGN